MPDLCADIASVDREIQERLITVMEMRAAEPRQREILETDLAWIDVPEDTRILEVGCGTGAATRVLARRPGVAAIVGVDPSPVFLDKARELAADQPHVIFQRGTFARSNSTTMSSTSRSLTPVSPTCRGPDQARRELFRVLKAGGSLAVFDGDYASTTLARGDHDPLQSCADAAMATLVHDRWLARRLPGLLKAAGFEVNRFDGHAYVQTIEPGYLLIARKPA